MALGDPEQPYGSDECRDVAERARELGRSITDFLDAAKGRVEATEAVRTRPFDLDHPDLSDVEGVLDVAIERAKELDDALDGLVDTLISAADKLDEDNEDARKSAEER